MSQEVRWKGKFKWERSWVQGERVKLKEEAKLNGVKLEQEPLASMGARLGGAKTASTASTGAKLIWNSTENWLDFLLIFRLERETASNLTIAFKMSSYHPSQSQSGPVPISEEPVQLWNE